MDAVTGVDLVLDDDSNAFNSASQAGGHSSVHESRLMSPLHTHTHTHSPGVGRCSQQRPSLWSSS